MYRKTCILCQRTSLKRWFGNRTMTSNCNVTNSAQQIQMTTLCHWMKPPPMKIFCVRHWGEVKRWDGWCYHWRQRYRSLASQYTGKNAGTLVKKLNRFSLTLWWKVIFKPWCSTTQKRRKRVTESTKSFIRRQNHNGEVVDRNWLCFSSSQTCVSCFTRGLMWANTTKCAHFLISFLKKVFATRSRLFSVWEVTSNQWSVQMPHHMPWLRSVADVINHYEELIQRQSDQSGQSIRTILEIASACNFWFLS